MAENPMKTRTHPNAVAVQKVADAWSMRIRGASWAEVARALGYSSPGNACRAVKNYVGSLPEPEMHELRSMWRERLESLWPIARRDVEDGRPGAMRAAVAVAQRAAQLDGLDQPQRVEVSGGADELNAMVRVILAAQGEADDEADIFDAEVVDDKD